MDDCWKKTGPEQQGPGPVRVHSPALTWLSLVGLLSSRAQLRVTRHHHCTQRKKPEYRA